MSQKKIKVLVVDDSALVRQILVEILKRAPDIEVVGTATDPFMARETHQGNQPGRADARRRDAAHGRAHLPANLMRLRPMPVVMVSSLTERGAETTLKALELGAFDFVSKPKIDVAGTLADFSDEILAKIRVAAGARVVGAQRARRRSARRAQVFGGCHPAGGGFGRGGQAHAAHHRSHHRRRRIDRWHGSDPRTAGGIAAGFARPS